MQRNFHMSILKRHQLNFGLEESQGNNELLICTVNCNHRIEIECLLSKKVNKYYTNRERDLDDSSRMTA